jgi:hypothetical protein
MKNVFFPTVDTSLQHQCPLCPSSNSDWQSGNLIAAPETASELM